MSDRSVDRSVAARADPLVDVCRVAALRVAHLPTGRPPARLDLRSAVIDRLIGAQSLLPRQFRLVVVAAHLPEGLARLPGQACPHVADHRTGGAVDLGVQVENGTESRPRGLAGPSPHPVGTPSLPR